MESLVAGLTPQKTLRSLEFPQASQYIGTDGFGKHYQATIGR